MTSTDVPPLVPRAAPGRVAIIGAGPAGLTAAYELTRHGCAVELFEATDDTGGISQTVQRDGWRFDIGGHRFFTKVPDVQEVWDALLEPEDFMVRERMSRIYYRGRLFDYPLNAANVLRNLGVVEAVRCLASYAWVRMRPPATQSSFETWVAARFGWRLYRTFFKTYTEKVWGVDANEIGADWAAQRIKNLSLLKAIRHALRPQSTEHITSLIEQFRYPKLGPGMMWERARERVEAAGAIVHMRSPVVRVEHGSGCVHAVVSRHDGVERRTCADRVISSMPLGDLVRALSPVPPARVLRAAARLRHRDFLTVALTVPREHAFADNWIYVHDPEVRVGRIQNFGAWSPFLVQGGDTCLGLEYFVNEGEDLWSASDDDLVEFAKRELTHLGLVAGPIGAVGYVVRMPKAYPVYDEGYAQNVDVIRRWLEQHLPDLQTVGRNGMHRYNNADHSMMTALLAARNLLGAQPAHDVWSVNVEEDYHEEVSTPAPRGTGRSAPVLRLRSAPTQPSVQVRAVGRAG